MKRQASIDSKYPAVPQAHSVARTSRQSLQRVPRLHPVIPALGGSRFLLLGFLLGILPAACLGQGSTGTIEGTIKDADGAVIPAAKVTIRNTDTNVVRTVTSESTGFFTVQALPAGNYDLRVEHDGFQTVSQQGIVLTVAQDDVLNLTLPVGGTNEVVQVDASGVAINVSDNAVAGLVSEHAIADLPLNGRNYVDLALMEPGTSQDYAVTGTGGAAATAFSNHGSTPWSNLFTLDGAILNNALALNSASQTGNTLGIDGVQEFKIVGLPDATYGLAMGGQIVIASKSGTNQFHGDVFEYIRNSFFDARSFFDYSYQAAPYKRISHFERNQFGGAVGGPIVRDKTFFFANYEGLRSSQNGNANGQPISDVVPAAGCIGGANQVVWNGLGTQPAGSIGPCTQLGANPAGAGTNSVTIAPVIAPILALYPATGGNLPNNVYTYSTSTPIVEDFGQIRVDQTFSEKDSAFSRYTIDNGTLTVPLNFPQFRQSLPGVGQFLTVGETHIFSSTLLNVARLSVSRSTQSVNNLYNGPNNFIGPQYSFVAGQPIGLISNFGGITGIGATAAKPSVDNLTLYTLSDDVSVTRGRHTMKFGTLLNLFRQAAGTNAGAAGTLSFSSLANFEQGISSGGSFLSAPAGTVLTPFVPAVNRYFGYSTFGFYAQDAWRATSRLTLDLGLRYEFQDTVTELNGHGYAIRNLATDTAATPGPILLNPTLKNFSPRVGFADDVFGNGKTSIRGGFGVYRDVGNLGSELREQIQGTPPYGSTAIGTTRITSFPVPLTNGSAGKSLDLVDFHDRAPYSLQYNLTVERSVFGMDLSATYIGLHGIHLWSRGEGNPVTPQGFGSDGRPFYSNAISQPACVLNGVFSAPYPTGTSAGNPFCRKNPFYSVVILNSTIGHSNYNSLELNLVSPVRHGLEFQTSYTYSKALDDTAAMGGFETAAAGCLTNQDPLDRKTDYGPSCFDTTNKFNVNLIYNLPGEHSNRLLRSITHGLRISNIVTAQSGLPFTPIVTADRANSGIYIQSSYDIHVNVNTAASIAAHPCTSQPDTPAAGANPCAYTPIPFNRKTVATHKPGQAYNPAMFSLAPVGTLGNAGRDMLRSPYLLVWNASAVKDIPLHFLGDKGVFQFRADLFNPINKANFGYPNGFVFTGSQSDAGMFSEAPLGTAGRIASTLTSSRQSQFAAKIIF